jgi:hypothetical protein
MVSLRPVSNIQQQSLGMKLNSTVALGSIPITAKKKKKEY